MGNYFSIERFIHVFPKVISSLPVNLHIVFWSMLLGTLLAVFVAVLRLHRVPVVSGLLGLYISFMRGTPLLVQMMIAFYGIPIVLGTVFLNLFGINLNRLEPVIFVEIAIILNEGAFLGEIFRGAITSVPAVQSEAGYSIGMTGAQTFVRIVPRSFHPGSVREGTVPCRRSKTSWRIVRTIKKPSRLSTRPVLSDGM